MKGVFTSIFAPFISNHSERNIFLMENVIQNARQNVTYYSRYYIDSEHDLVPLWWWFYRPLKAASMERPCSFGLQSCSMPWLGVSQTRFSIGNTDMSTNNFNSPQIADADRTCKTKGPLPYSEPKKCTPRRVCNRKDPRELPVTTENLDISTREEIAEIKAKAAETAIIAKRSTIGRAL